MSKRKWKLPAMSLLLFLVLLADGALAGTVFAIARHQSGTFQSSTAQPSTIQASTTWPSTTPLSSVRPSGPRTSIPQASTAQPRQVALTFDDGPSDRTDEVLKILDEKGVKATFFVIGREDETSIQRIKKAAAAGHTIGMHSYSHDYEKIYTSVEDFLDDFYKLFVILRDEAGVTPTVFRFPGGSLNNYNQGVYKEIIAEMLRRGFRYYDWNLSAEDAAKKSPSASTIVEGITSYSAQKKHGVVLMHDSAHCKTTVEALPALIDTLREQGFDFAPLDRTVRQVSFHYRSASNQS